MPLRRPGRTGREARAVSWYAREKRHGTLVAALRFIWNATRGHRLAPWRSEYLRWRVETYSGQRAETLTAMGVLGFAWGMRWELLRFLAWTGQMEREARVKQGRGD